jgi:hypothetical protein
MLTKHTKKNGKDSMPRLIGLVKSSTEIVHAVLSSGATKTLSGIRYLPTKNISFSGRSSVTRERCKKKIPEDVI